MVPQYFKDHLSYILTWWEDFIDWEKGGVFTVIKPFTKIPVQEYKIPLMHLRQLYNYSVGFEQGHPRAEKIANHLANSLFEVFPERQGSLMISSDHRLTTVKNCDRILVLDARHIMEEGNHQDLLQKNETYATLWNQGTTPAS